MDDPQARRLARKAQFGAWTIWQTSSLIGITAATNLVYGVDRYTKLWRYGRWRVQICGREMLTAKAAPFPKYTSARSMTASAVATSRFCSDLGSRANAAGTAERWSAASIIGAATRTCRLRSQMIGCDCDDVFIEA